MRHALQRKPPMRSHKPSSMHRGMRRRLGYSIEQASFHLRKMKQSEGTNVVCPCNKLDHPRHSVW